MKPFFTCPSSPHPMERTRPVSVNARVCLLWAEISGTSGTLESSLGFPKNAHMVLQLVVR